MRNSVYNLLKQIKHASAMSSGSFTPPEPLPNSVKANQIQQQELAAEQSEATAGTGNDQLMQMQKAQEDAVSQLQQAQQQLAQTQGELQSVQAQAQQQQQEVQMQAQQEIQKAQMDAQYELQSEKIKNQQQLLSVQEKYMRSAGKAKPDQNHILSSQLKRVVKKVNGLKVANTTAAGLKATGIAAGKTLGRAVPIAGAAISGASAVNNLSKGNYLSAGLDALGGAASFIPLAGIPLSIGAGLASSYFENPENPEKPAPVQPDTINPAAAGGPQLYQKSPLGQQLFGGMGQQLFGGMGQQAPGYVPQQRSWDAGLSPSERFSVLNTTQKMGAVAPVKQPEYPDIRKFMKNPPPPGEYVSSPIPMWQAGFKQHDMNMPTTKQQGYGPVGDFVKQLIFQIGLPMFGMRNPMHPDFSRVYGGLENNEAYKLRAPQTFSQYQ
jgi:TolA-binding protein